GRGPAWAGDVLLEPEVDVGERGDLRQVGDAEDLAAGAERPQPLADDAGGVAADAGVDLVEDQGAGRAGAAEVAERQHHPRELAARGGVADRRRLDPRVRRQPQLDRLAAARPEVVGVRLEYDLQRRPGHR